ncbi:MAG TPA: PD-(D/E)XK nuclease family protein [Methanoregulaceae archaeon]|nr:PD-(D/E)XK nuclease family protein [Methanothrix sp.]HOK07776.1 PD-(D/E)XK nuclease family protein [Syntrophales bacterium]HON93784.1 PD-(D/E)XK nuclease family protein [Sedimentisphaerales bacterium]HPD11230.1 PD-(D/E)XK nuclease family protein [Methanoregulaceae archaeon]HRT52204.1 PD-(D/E)XK nuclease family protein [Anaerohalosphaeraceae bacterium]HOL44481.1 PD-(D/E)XK nuclease family protein [Methanothrix sp.]
MLADILHKVAAEAVAAKRAAEGKPAVEPYRPRPSLAGPERCLRQLVYMAREIPPSNKMNERFVVVLEDSSWHEEFTAFLNNLTAYTLHSRQNPVKCGVVTHKGEPFEIWGHIDGIITDSVGVSRLWEHKAINHFTWQRYLAGHFPLDYLTQVCLYLYGLREDAQEIREAVLLVKNKNTSAYLEFLLDYDVIGDRLTVKHVLASDGTYKSGANPQVFTGLYSYAMKRFEEIETHRKNGTLPGREYEWKTDWQCSYCQYRDACMRDGDADICGDIVLDKATATLAREYRRLVGEKKILENKVNGIEKALRLYLSTRKVNRVEGNGCMIEIRTQARKRLDKSLLPEDVIKAATVTDTVEILKVVADMGEHGES